VLARGPQLCPAMTADCRLCFFAFPLHICGFPLALARGPQLCPAMTADCRLCFFAFPLHICGFPLALARGPQLCSPRGSGQKETAAEESPRPRPGGNLENEWRGEKHTAPRHLNKPGFPSRLREGPNSTGWSYGGSAEFPLALARGPQPCSPRGSGQKETAAEESPRPRPGGNLENEWRGEKHTAPRHLNKPGFPSRSREGPNRAPQCLRYSGH